MHHGVKEMVKQQPVALRRMFLGEAIKAVEPPRLFKAEMLTT